MSFKEIKSFAGSHLSLSGFKNDCKRLYGKIFGKLVHVLEALSTALDKVSRSPRTELSFNKSIYKRKTDPWSVGVKLHYWRLERNEQKARSLMKDFLEKLVERGAGIKDLSSDQAIALTSDLIEILLELDTTVFKAFSIAKGREASVFDMRRTMGALFDEVKDSIVGSEKLKELLGEKGFLYQFVRACEQLNVIKVNVKSEDGEAFMAHAINCLSIRGYNFVNNTLPFYFEMMESELHDQKESLQKQINEVSADDEDLRPITDLIYERFRLPD